MAYKPKTKPVAVPVDDVAEDEFVWTPTLPENASPEVQAKWFAEFKRMQKEALEKLKH